MAFCIACHSAADRRLRTFFHCPPPPPPPLPPFPASCLWGRSPLALTAISISSCTATSVLTPEPRAAVARPVLGAGAQRDGLHGSFPPIRSGGYPRVDFSPARRVSSILPRKVECPPALRRPGCHLAWIWPDQ